MTMVIIGVLAVVALPRFSGRQSFDSRGFHDQAIAVLRYAQKAAIAQRRFVCVAFTANSVTLTYDATPPSTTHATASCPGAGLTGPDGSTPYAVSSSHAAFTAVPAAFSFDALGRPSAPRTITVSGYTTSIKVAAETGYVY